MEKTKIEGYKKVCDICGIAITSLSKKQLNYNYFLHHSSCQEKKKKNPNYPFVTADKYKCDKEKSK